VSVELGARIERVRAALARRPDGYTIGAFPDGLSFEDGPVGLPPALCEVLSMSDGARGGVVVLFSANRLINQNFSCDGLDVIDDPGVWLRVGTNDDEPLLLHRQTGELWWFPDNGTVWYMSDRFELLAPDMVSFVGKYLLGDGYLDISPAPDDWYAFLRDHGLARALQ
jgi:hypothetical protein